MNGVSNTHTGVAYDTLDAAQQSQQLKQEQRLRREIELVQKASLGLISSLDLQHVLNDILETALILLRFQDANIFLVENDRLVFGAAITEDGKQPAPFAEPRPNGLTQTVLRTGETIVVSDSQYHPLFRNAPAEWGRFAIMGQPLRVRGDTVGVMNVAFQTPGSISNSERRILNLLATYAAIAIQNATLHEHSLQHAAKLEERVAERTVELRQERNRLRTVLDSAGDGIHFGDRDGIIQYVNAATEQITGYSAAELIGQTPRAWRGSTSAAIIADLEQSWRQGRGWQGEVVNRRKDGTLYDAHINVSPIFNDEGQLAGYVEVQRDITQLKELEQLKNQFVSRIGHELRTPIANIKLYLDLLERRDSNNGRYLQVLNTESERLERLVAGFMELSHLDADSDPPPIQEIDLNEVLAACLIRWQSILARHNLTLCREAQAATPVWGNVKLLEQVLDKLLDNAAKYTPAGGSVSLATWPQTKNGETWTTITIKDTGPGLSDAEMRHIFERFYRGEAARDFRIPGAGLGLAFCREALQKMGGELTARTDSDEGGAAFTIWLRPA